MISATKTQDDLLSTPGLWFGDSFALFGNIKETLTYNDGIFLRWLGNTLLYVVVGAGGATLLATAAGYGLAKYKFAGRRAVFAVLLGAIAIPGTALAVPTFLMFSKLGLTNTVWAIIIPSLISPFGLYLMWVYATEAIPYELLEAARIDGAGEVRIFFTVVAAAARARRRDGAAVRGRGDLEQLLPAADHAQQTESLPAHGRPHPVEQPGDRRRRRTRSTTW